MSEPKPIPAYEAVDIQAARLVLATDFGAGNDFEWFGALDWNQVPPDHPQDTADSSRPMCFVTLHLEYTEVRPKNNTDFPNRRGDLVIQCHIQHGGGDVLIDGGLAAAILKRTQDYNAAAAALSNGSPKWLVTGHVSEPPTVSESGWPVRVLRIPFHASGGEPELVRELNDASA